MIRLPSNGGIPFLQLDLYLQFHSHDPPSLCVKRILKMMRETTSRRISDWWNLYSERLQCSLPISCLSTKVVWIVHLKMKDWRSCVHLDRSSQDGIFGEAVCIWIVHLKTGESVISKTKVTEEIAKVMDLIWLANLRGEHLKKLRRLPLKYNAEDRVLADQFIKVVQFCVKNHVWAGSVFSKRN
ncbi:hypothetical protein HanPI659440_Chr09g0323871 [Helianthus annuus]|nr:hypothetical protein HanPI659440_Chr09g0323871 [Helianthus annuus]